MLNFSKNKNKNIKIVILQIQFLENMVSKNISKVVIIDYFKKNFKICSNSN